MPLKINKILNDKILRKKGIEIWCIKNFSKNQTFHLFSPKIFHVKNI